MPMPKQVEQNDETERREQDTRTVEAENAAIAASSVDPAKPPQAAPAMSESEKVAAAERHVAAERSHAVHERRMAIVNTGTGEPRAYPTPDWHPLDVPQPRTERPVEPTPHTVPFDAIR